ncbi:uncharacterized protein AMSG_02554 [Thecamonas trahens ATCC 50062]|uniref:Uncharacterized protein n=1 Tax=Thecamonas trahens ATCC 50062 TaxID=461836 RepID=A0A0L0D580_THETB|nr:hypothetical protein AMSG_02554 [Thecamonas trahens ATCC 50062]KNC47532.1 hypothetical protein AMSG_02554 [Thecamonas trahens ATCC 50062]|eukprot:XP_013759464.1 hypothetical protein AMSG_02554 [Thecamonas trahens ATCC 50062]
MQNFTAEASSVIQAVTGSRVVLDPSMTRGKRLWMRALEAVRRNRKKDGWAATLFSEQFKALRDRARSKRLAELEAQSATAKKRIPRRDALDALVDVLETELTKQRRHRVDLPAHGQGSEADGGTAGGGGGGADDTPSFDRYSGERLRGRGDGRGRGSGRGRGRGRGRGSGRRHGGAHTRLLSSKRGKRQSGDEMLEPGERRKRNMQRRVASIASVDPMAAARAASKRARKRLAEAARAREEAESREKQVKNSISAAARFAEARAEQAAERAATTVEAETVEAETVEAKTPAAGGAVRSRATERRGSLFALTPVVSNIHHDPQMGRSISLRPKWSDGESSESTPMQSVKARKGALTRLAASAVSRRATPQSSSLVVNQRTVMSRRGPSASTSSPGGRQVKKGGASASGSRAGGQAGTPPRSGPRLRRGSRSTKVVPASSSLSKSPGSPSMRGSGKQLLAFKQRRHSVISLDSPRTRMSRAEAAREAGASKPAHDATDYEYSRLSVDSLITFPDDGMYDTINVRVLVPDAEWRG